MYINRNTKKWSCHYLVIQFMIISVNFIQAAATTCYVATNPRLIGVSGKYFSDCNETSVSNKASSLNEASELWTASEIMVSTDTKLVNAFITP